MKFIIKYFNKDKLYFLIYTKLVVRILTCDNQIKVVVLLRFYTFQNDYHLIYDYKLA